MKLPPHTIGAKVSFTDKDGVARPQSDGIGCAVGTRCSFALQKHVVKLLGDDSGNSDWGNCVSRTPYSLNQCLYDCSLGLGNARCSQTVNGPQRLHDACVAQAMQACDESSNCQIDDYCPDGKACYPRCDDVAWPIVNAERSQIPVPGFLYLGHSRANLDSWLHVQWQRSQAQNSQPISIVDDEGLLTVLTCAEHLNCSYRELTVYTEQNMILLTVYLQSLTQTELTESQSVQFSSLTATVGGNMGLCLGISMMTFFEWFEWIFVALLSYTCLKSTPCGRSTAGSTDAESTLPDATQGTAAEERPKYDADSKIQLNELVPKC
jgi:hypothetical protein